MRELLYILVAPMASLVGLAAFETWWSAAVFVSAIGVTMVFAVRRHERHQRSEAFDDKVSTDRMIAAREWLMKEMDD